MIIQSRNVYFDEELRELQVEFNDGKITNIMPFGTKKADRDYGDNWIIPGMIDIHTHGYNGHNFDGCDIKWLKEWLEFLPKEGVTGMLAGSSSAPRESILQAMRNAYELKHNVAYKGTELLGVYSEGPFMSYDFRGAQDPAYLRVPTKEDIDEMIDACKELMVYVMVAPEMFKGDMSVIRYLREKGITVACGHTGATFEEITQAREAGAQSFTHTYNGMRGLHHREAGVVGAAMYYDDMYAEMIGDGVHVSFPSMNVLAKAKGKDKLISITDAVSAKGLPTGVYDYGDYSIEICEDGVVRLPNGTIAGSCNRLNVILGREIQKANIPYVTAINSCTCNPARLLGYDNRKGYIKKNYDADICVLDKDFNVVQTYCFGEEML